MSPGLVVIGDDSCLTGHGFESLCHILDGHFFTLICCKTCIFVWKDRKWMKKRPRLAHFIRFTSLCTNWFHITDISGSQRKLIPNTNGLQWFKLLNIPHEEIYSGKLNYSIESSHRSVFIISRHSAYNIHYLIQSCRN